jgi:hypothetical protein
MNSSVGFNCMSQSHDLTLSNEMSFTLNTTKWKERMNKKNVDIYFSQAKTCSSSGVSEKISVNEFFSCTGLECEKKKKRGKKVDSWRHQLLVQRNQKP